MDTETFEEKLIYMCVACNQTLDEETVNNSSHICSEAVVETLEDEDTVQQEVMHIQGEGEAIELSEEWTTSTASKPRRSEWCHDDIQRLLNIYMKNLKIAPGARNSHYLWDRIMRELRQYGNFSRYLVQAKLKKMKKTCLSILASNSTTKWTYFDQICQLLRLEQELEENQGDGQVGEIEALETDVDTETDEEGEEVVGLHRWNIRETRHLIEVYKRHLPHFFTSGNRRKITWNAILAELDYDLPQRFSMYQIRAKIRNVVFTYKNIVQKKRKKKSITWPLYNDVAALVAMEQELAKVNGITDFHSWQGEVQAEEPVEDSEETEKKETGIRWNVEETKLLLEAYKKRIYDLCLFPNGDKNDSFWDEIAREVNEVRRKKISGHQAKVKLENLRAAYQSGNEKRLVPLYNEAKEVFDGEISFADPSETPVRSPERKWSGEENAESVPFAASTKKNRFPTWYVHYAQDANRRHKEKIDVQTRIVETLGAIIERYKQADVDELL